MNLFLIIITTIFLLINLQIVISDFKRKIIPNKKLIYLLILLPFYQIYLYVYGIHINSVFYMNVFIALIISFALYYYGLWSAGDAKYLLVLSLFVSNIGIIPFIGNIAIITLIYLLTYFILFYLMVIFKPKFAKSVFENIFIDSKDKIFTFLKNPNTGNLHAGESTYKILKEILYFLLFFVFMRIIRGDIIDGVKSLGIFNKETSNLGSHFIFGTWIIAMMIAYSYKRILNFLNKIASIIFKDKLKIEISQDKLKILKVLSAVIPLLALISIDYYRSGNQIFHKIYLILTIYLALSLTIKTLIYAGKLTFQVGEQKWIGLNLLSEGDIVDKQSLIKTFGSQSCLGYGVNLDEKKSKKGILYPSPYDWFNGIENPIDKETIKKLKNIYKITNAYHFKNKTAGYKENLEIKILNTFSFGGYIFAGFIVTVLFGDGISTYIVRLGYNIFKMYTDHGPG